jgi:hypothetical protein
MVEVENGFLVYSPKHINFNHNMWQKSLEKLITYDIQKVNCYHGGLYGNKVKKYIEELANKHE